MRPAQRFALPLRIAAPLYNAVPSVLWSVLAFVPASIFCYRFMARPFLWTFLAVSFIGFILPASTLKRLQLSSNARTYRRLGVHWANHFVQHGALINRLLRQSHPEYQRVSSRPNLVSLRQITYMQERFHWTVLLFFLQSSVYAIARGYPGWALLITVLNLVYNLYPIWLQQYIRLRLNRSRSA